MNKALELIEASVLFSMPHKKIKVLIHPEAIIHGIIYVKDGSVFSHRYLYSSPADHFYHLNKFKCWPVISWDIRF